MMRKFTQVLMLVSVMGMGLAGSSHAVQLEEGWYAEFAYVGLEGTVYPDQSWGVTWHATSATGQFGPLSVTASSPASSYGRRLIVTQTSDANPGTIFEDWGAYSAGYPWFDKIGFSWRTSYNASALQLRMYQRRSGWSDDHLIWSQYVSGPAVNLEVLEVGPTVLPGDSIGFRIVVIPEPSSAMSMLGGMALILFLRRKPCA